jgi:hypothetical protein
MSSKSAISLTKRQEVQEKAGQITSVLEEYLKPLVEPLDAVIEPGKSSEKPLYRCIASDGR